METDTIQLVDPLVLAIEAATAGGFFILLKKFWLVRYAWY